MYKDILIFIFGIGVIIKSADLFTSGAEGIACAFRISRVIIGLTIVSLATTAPEFTVSVISSSMGVGGMAVGNALGSCLANIGLILAIAAIINPIKLNPRVLRRELPFLIFVVFILYFLMWDNLLGFVDGVFLCFLLIAFFTYIILRENRLKRESAVNDISSPEKKHNSSSLKKYGIKFLLGALGVVLAAKYAIIPSGINIARFFGMPEVVIGLTMVAVGTSLPELFTAIVASAKKMGELAFGNVIGANILNILWVLGASSCVRPLEIDTQTRTVTMPLVFIVTVLILLFSGTRLKLSRNKGLIFFVIYAGYIFSIFKFVYS